MSAKHYTNNTIYGKRRIATTRTSSINGDWIIHQFGKRVFQTADTVDEMCCGNEFDDRDDDLVEQSKGGIHSERQQGDSDITTLRGSQMAAHLTKREDKSPSFDVLDNNSLLFTEADRTFDTKNLSYMSQKQKSRSPLKPVVLQKGAYAHNESKGLGKRITIRQMPRPASYHKWKNVTTRCASQTEGNIIKNISVILNETEQNTSSTADKAVEVPAGSSFSKPMTTKTHGVQKKFDDPVEMTQCEVSCVTALKVPNSIEVMLMEKWLDDSFSLHRRGNSQTMGALFKNQHAYLMDYFCLHGFDHNTPLLLLVSLLLEKDRFTHFSWLN